MTTDAHDNPGAMNPSDSAAGPIVARVTTGYRIRLLLLTAGLLVYGGGFFLYDGFIGYPKDNERRDEFVADQEKAKQGEMTNQEFREKWGDRETSPVGHNESDIFTQKLIGFVCAPLGLWALFGFTTSLVRRVELRGDELVTNYGHRMTMDQIEHVDMARWDSKGIAVVQPSGGGKRLILDDWKFDRQAIDGIVAQLEAALPPEKLINRPPAEPAAEDKEQQAPTAEEVAVRESQEAPEDTV